MDEFIEGKKGKTTYNIPVFKAFKMKDEYRQLAINTDKILQDFLKDYKSRQAEKEAAKEEPIQAPAAAPISQMPMADKNGKYAAVPSDVRELETDSDLPF